MSIIPEHLLKDKDINDSEFSRHPVGTGPYKLKSWSTQDKIELVSNHDYFEKRPYLDRYIYRVIPDEATIFLELQTRNIDSAGLTPLQYSRQTDGAFFKKNFRKFLLPSFTYVYMGYNLSDPKFKDLRVRQALNYAVDKEEIIKIVLLGYGTVSNGPFVPQLWAHNPKVKPCEYDPELAKELLRQAGWADSNQDGWLDKEKKRFEFTIITNQGNQERIKTAQIIQRRLKDIGIKVNIKVIEWSVFIAEFIDKRNFEAIIMGWSLPLDPDNFDIWHSSKTRPGEFNFVGFQNKELDSLLEEGRREFNQEKRKSIYWRINQILYAEQPYMFLYVPDSLSILSSRFEGVKPEPIGIGYNFIDWWVPKDKQKYRAVQ